MGRRLPLEMLMMPLDLLDLGRGRCLCCHGVTVAEVGDGFTVAHSFVGWDRYWRSRAARCRRYSSSLIAVVAGAEEEEANDGGHRCR
ncbi:hypothetical protein ACLOJK_041099 [Asimina triloba]